VPARFNLWAIVCFPARNMLNCMDQPGNGGAVRVAMGKGAMPAEFSAAYQAGFEAGYTQGREDGYQVACREAARESRANPGAKPSVSPPRRRGLLGLPCEHCGTFLFSDETLCPHCKKTSGGR
jgi:hypothetical protein